MGFLKRKWLFWTALLLWSAAACLGWYVLSAAGGSDPYAGGMLVQAAPETSVFPADPDGMGGGSAGPDAVSEAE